MGSCWLCAEGKTEKRQLQRGLTALDRSNLFRWVVNDLLRTDNNELLRAVQSGSAQVPN